MNIDESKLQPLLWAVVGAWKAGDQDLQMHTDALDEFLGEHTVEQVALQLLAELGLSNEAQELYRADKIRLAHEVDRLRGENQALRKEREGMTLVPMVPSEGLLMSMAIRHDHGLAVPGYYDQALIQKANHGVSHARMVEFALSEMRKLYEEVVGTGFYSPQKESGYAAMAKEAPHG